MMIQLPPKKNKKKPSLLVATKKREKRRVRTQQLHYQLSLKPVFTPLSKYYQIRHIHRATSIELMYQLIDLAHRTHTFTMDTETNHRCHQPALIQIEFVHTTDPTIILLIETVHLPPDRSSRLFWLIQTLLKIIFQSTNTILIWGNAKHELSPFLSYEIMDFNTIDQLYFIDVQYYFKIWYNKTFLHQCHHVQDYHDNLSCTCAYRPYKRSDERWSLQQAIAYTFNEFLNKHCVQNNWIQGLDDQLHHNSSDGQQQHHHHHHHHRQNLIQYAVNDCLAVTKLSMVIFNHWTLEQLQHYLSH